MLAAALATVTQIRPSRHFMTFSFSILTVSWVRSLRLRSAMRLRHSWVSFLK